MIPLAKAIPITGLAPDDEPTKPGVIIDCVNMVPTTNGVKASYGFYNADARSDTPDAATCIFRTRDTAGAEVLVLGSSAQLSVFTDPDSWGTRVNTSVTAAAQPWQMAQFGNAVLATGYAQRIKQASASGGWVFTEIADAPKAKLIVSAANFVLAFGTNDATYGEQGDRWWCSAINDHSSWTPSLSTQATTGRIVQDGGGFKAALPLGQNVVAYKDRSMFVGSYVGSPVVWQWDRAPGYAGAAGPGCVCDIGGAHFIVGPDGFWIFDGVRPQPVGFDVISQSFFRRMSRTSDAKKVLCYYDRPTTCVHVWYVAAYDSGVMDSCLVYNVTTGAWGKRKHSQQIHAVGSVGEYGNPSVGRHTQALSVYDPATYSFRLAIESNSETTGQPSITTGVFGDYSTSTRVLDLRLTCASGEATGATVEGYTGRSPGAVTTLAGTGVEMDGKIPVRQHDRWHKFKISLPYVYGSAALEIRAITVNGVTGGSR